MQFKWHKTGLIELTSLLAALLWISYRYQHTLNQLHPEWILLGLGIGNRYRASAPAKDIRHLRCIFDQMPGLVGHLHFDQHIAWEKFAFRAYLGAAPHFDDFFNRHQNLFDHIRQVRLHGLFLDRFGDFFLESRIDVNDVPAHCHQSGPQPEYQFDARREHLIDEEKEQRRQNNHHEHHTGRDQGFAARRPYDFRRFLAHLLEKLKRVNFGHSMVHFTGLPDPGTLKNNRLKSYIFSNLAGAEGFEPSTCGFGDRRSTS